MINSLKEVTTEELEKELNRRKNKDYILNLKSKKNTMCGALGILKNVDYTEMTTRWYIEATYKVLIPPYYILKMAMDSLEEGIEEIENKLKREGELDD